MDLPVVGSAALVVGSRTYANRQARVLRYTSHMAEIELDDGKTVKVKKQNLKAIEQDNTNTCKFAEISTNRACNKRSQDARQCDGFLFSADTSGNSDDSDDCMDGASGASSRSLGVSSLATNASAVGSVAQMTFVGITWGARAIAHIVLGGRKEPTYFLKWFFRDALLEIRPRDGVEKAQREEEYASKTYGLCASKVDSEGRTFWGGPNDVVRLFYVRKETHGDSLQSKLERIAGFGKLQQACKVASRLELLVSSAAAEREFELTVVDFELINEPQPTSDSGGCGFISEGMLAKFFGKGIKGRRMTGIQVRVVSPALGIFKGMLCKKQGISKIQLPPSMRKVGPSLDRAASAEQWVWMLVTQDFPSTNNLQVAKFLKGGTPCKSYKQVKFSKMMQRLMTTLGVPRGVVSDYAKQDLRKEAWLVGASDPTFPSNVLPAGHIFVSGLPAEQVPLRDGQHKVFVTRSPCTRPEDGHMLPLVTSKPTGMSDHDWQAFSERHFGEVLFSNRGIAIPEAISEGDLDGDLYYVCWDVSVIQHIKPVSLKKHPIEDRSKELSKKREPLGDNWFLEAQNYMLSDDGAKAKQLIGKLYRAGEKVADESPLGLHDPDARAYFKAYTQAIDAGKHGNAIDLPDRLREKLGMPLPRT